MREVSPRSGAYRVRAIGDLSFNPSDLSAQRARGRNNPSVWDETLVTEHRPDLLHVGVGGRQDQLGGLQAVGRQRGADLPHVVEQVVQGLAEALVVAGLDGGFELTVEGVQRVQ